MKIQLVSHERVGNETEGDHGGVGISQRMIARGLVQRGHEVELLVSSNGDWIRKEEGYTIRGWRPASGRFHMTRLMMRQYQHSARFRKGGGDITVIPDSCATSWWYPLPTKKVVKFTCTHLLQKYEAAFEKPDLQEVIARKWVVMDRRYSKHERPRPSTAIAERLMVPRADAFTAISARTAMVSARLLRIPLDRITVIPNAVDTSLYRPVDAPRHSGFLLYVGTVCEKKGAREAVGAVDALVREGRDVRLIMIGRNGVDYHGRGDFVGRIASEYPDTCRHHVQFLGHVSNADLPGYYQRAAVVILPSYYESFGRTTIEAMACGAPVVRSDAPPADEIIDDGVEGLLCKTKDSADLGAKIRVILDNPDLGGRLGKAASAKMQSRYSVEAVAMETERFFGALMGT